MWILHVAVESFPGILCFKSLYDEHPWHFCAYGVEFISIKTLLKCIAKLLLKGFLKYVFVSNI